MAKEKLTATVNPVSKVKALFKNVNATEKTNGTLVISSDNLDNITDNLPDGAKLIQNKNNPNLYAVKVGEQKVIFEVIETKKRGRKPATSTPTKATSKPTSKASTSNSEINHKPKGDGYIILYKANGKKEQKLTNMSTCAEVKAWLKTISRKNTEYLRIYDSANRECRKSAWI